MGAVFYLPILVGFFLAFFVFSEGWQLTGLILAFAAFLAFAAAAKHYRFKIFKFFFVGFAALMLIYELIHAGIGSNRSLSTTSQWNVGFLGIGIIFAVLLISLLFSLFFFTRTITNIYADIIKPKGFLAPLG